MEAQTLEKTYPVLGVNISSYSKDDFFTAIDEVLSKKSKKTKPLFIVTVNPEIAIHAIIDNNFKDILKNSSINTADGVGISWAVNFLYGKKVDRITGSDSVEKICGIAAKTQSSAFFYGALPTVAKRAALLLQQQIPGLLISGTYSPERSDLNFEDLPLETQSQLQKACVIFVALGAPAQEKWIYRNLPYLSNCKVIIGIGGSFDFITGEVKRAPAAMRKTGLEWAYRLYAQPSRWRRMMKLPLFALNVVLLKSSSKGQRITTQNKTPQHIHS